ncbi:GNAT family N-acetyltransferase [Streptomyces sp. TRM 70351]|uniref:GNAT family N-acetyltransferase n=1 Tax=Streptomyces sp. TRM 70351 TaxID=3116552 RepID=UPI002E7C50C5|nr:GNAT family N-acetyltransferase [Streptomyces sp. TRM 70351]MEE1928659.1 GNAT family N-acetyltransferase [Streptomyces sp. TRM 70351]
MPEITRIDAAELAVHADGLADLLAATVDGGASVGFLAPLDHAAARAWWTAQAPAVADGGTLLWLARSGPRVTGTVSLRRGAMPNGRHRAEVAKLMVHPDARGQGTARALLAAAEQHAAGAGITLLVLDSETGSPAHRLYRDTGWTECGTVPDYAADATGTLRPTTYFYKRTRPCRP